MKKWFFNLFLAGCVLVFASFGRYDAFMQANDAAPSEASVQSGLSFSSAEGHIRTTIVSTLSNVKITFDNTDTENQDNQPESSKKDSGSGSYFANFYSSQIPGYYCQYFKNSLQSVRRIFNFMASRRYITLKVLRL